MRDVFVLRQIKRVARWHFQANLWLDRAWKTSRGMRLHTLGGECRRCARCCEAPGIQVGRLTWYLPMLRALFLWWQEKVNGWTLVSRDVSSRVFIFECAHFDRETRSDRKSTRLNSSHRL